MHRLTSLGVGLVITAALLLMIGCRDGGESGGATPQPTGQTGATATPQANVQPPTRPADFGDYPDAIAAYLTEVGDAALGPPCLAELLAAWQMPPAPQPELSPVASILVDGCLLANTDADSDLEVVVALTFVPDGDATASGVLSNIAVFDRSDGAFVPAFQTAAGAIDRFPGLVPTMVLIIADVNGDGAVDIVYVETFCGAHTCTHTVHSVSSDGTAYIKLTPDEGLSMETADVLLEDRDGDGVQEIVLHGGTISSVGAGVQRTRTEVYAWNGVLYELAETIFDASGLLYFAIRAADLLFDAGDYAAAADAYRGALADGSLAESGFQENERAELSAYAVFRIALSQLAAGGSQADAIAALEQPLAAYAGTVNVGLGEVFAVAYSNAGDLHVACLAVRDHITANLDGFQAVWEYGYANPTFDAENVCPF